METCQEMSQTPPAIAETVASSDIHTVQGTRCERVSTAGWVSTAVVVLIEVILSLAVVRIAVKRENIRFNRKGRKGR